MWHKEGTRVWQQDVSPAILGLFAFLPSESVQNGQRSLRSCILTKGQGSPLHLPKLLHSAAAGWQAPITKGSWAEGD